MGKCLCSLKLKENYLVEEKVDTQGKEMEIFFFAQLREKEQLF